MKRCLTLPRAEEVLDAQRVQVQTLERQQREEQPALALGDEGVQALGLRGILFDERDRVDLDVGVLADLVRVRVVAGVLADPPAVADADDAGREDPGEAIVRRAGGEDRAVRGLMGEERRPA